MVKTVKTVFVTVTDGEIINYRFSNMEPTTEKISQFLELYDSHILIVDNRAKKILDSFGLEHLVDKGNNLKFMWSKYDHKGKINRLITALDDTVCGGYIIRGNGILIIRGNK